MKFDEVLIEIGEFGSYQKRVYFLVSLPSLSVAFCVVMSVFQLGVPLHRCAIPGYENDTYEVHNEYHQMLINKTIPPSSDEDLLFDKCNLYNVMNNDYDVNNKPINASLTACSRWVYDKTVFISTFTSEKDLVCDKAILPTVSKMVFFIGLLIGALLFGILSDIIGRKRTMLIALIFNIGSTIGLSWTNSFALYVTLTFCIGTSTIGIFTSCFVIGLELVGPSKRMWAGIIYEYFFATGLLVLAGVAYALRDWQKIQMAVSFPNLLYLSYYWIIPESARWLMSQGRYKEAERILRKAARVNKKQLPNKIFDKPFYIKAPKGQFWRLFSTRTMASRTLIIFFNWLVVSLTYYGLSLNSGNLGGNLYLNFTLVAVVEFPAYTVCLLLLDRLGRKWLHCICMLVGGVACVSTVFTTIYGGHDLLWLTITLAMIGKLGASAAFAVIYIFSAELFPTVVRNAGIGASSCCARIGGMAAPYIADLSKMVPGNFGRALSLVTFGTFTIAAGFLALFLPETLNRQLPESIEDAEHFGRLRCAEMKNVGLTDEIRNDEIIELHTVTETDIHEN